MSSVNTDRKVKTSDISNGFANVDIFDKDGALLIKKGDKVRHVHYHRMREDGLIQEACDKVNGAPTKRNLQFSPPDSIHSRLNWVKRAFSTLQKQIVGQPKAELRGDLAYICGQLINLCEENTYQVMGELYLSDFRHYASIKPLYVAASLHELINRYNEFYPDQLITTQQRHNLLQAALLHNLGLLNSHLYNNKQELTDEERHEIRRNYPRASTQLAEKIGINESETLETIAQHNTEAEDPHLGAHLLRMPFVYAGIAMRERRQHEMLNIINPTREFARLFAENRLDPILGGLFLKINGLAPVGSILQFDSREKAVVLSGPDEDNIASSKLRMIANSSGVQLGWPGTTFRLDTTQLKQKGLTNHHQFAWNKFAPFAAWEK
jgi:hypothetical protein